MAKVAVFLPGLMGSVLMHGDEVIWPGSLTELVLPYNKMDQLMMDDLKATDVIRNFSISEQYESIIRDLGVFGFKGEFLHLCPYDWRKSNKEAAKVLASKITAILHQHGIDTEIYLVAHSMGGLVSRYYLESDEYRNSPEHKAVRALFTLGTPHLGAPLALSCAMGHEKRLFLSKGQVSRLVNDPRFPSLYELLPPQGEPFASAFQISKNLEPIDIYGRNIWKSLNLTEANVYAAKSFRGALDLQKRPDHVRYFFFVGTRQPTISLVRIKEGSPDLLQTIEIETSGDGTVPIWSAAPTGVQSQPVGGEHHVIYQNAEVRRTLGRLFGYVGPLAAVSHAEVSVRDRVVEPNTAVFVAITLGSIQGDLNAELKIERVDIDQANHLIKCTPISIYPIQYRGVAIERFNVSFDGPDIRGIYRVGFYVDNTLLGQDDLFVQELHQI